MTILTTGNVAKLYCLNWIENYAKQNKNKEIKILDLGCGAGLNFVKLLKLYPKIYYVGIEPSKQECKKAAENLKGLNTKIINGYAYNTYGLLREKFDIVVSFSALEHVYNKLVYIKSAKECLKEDGFFIINYDAGHFMSGNSKVEKIKNIIGPILAKLGIERYYQKFVREKEFINIIEKLNLKITDSKSFNTRLKELYKIIPENKKGEYMEKWLEFELWLNQTGINYTDSKASLLGTRSFILTHKRMLH